MKRERTKGNNRIWIGVFTVAAVYIALVAGVLAFRFYLNNLVEESDGRRYEQCYAMITGEGDSSFWQSVYQGAYARGQEENVYVDLLGANLSSAYSREELMRIALLSDVDGIIVAADESEEMTELIDEAVREGIPVVTIYNDNAHSDRCSFVGVGSYNLGREYGRQVLKIVEDRAARLVHKYTEEEGYTVIRDEGWESPIRVAVLVNAYTSDSSQNILCSGIQDAVDQAGASGKEIEISLIMVDDTNAFLAEESIRDLFMEGELPNIIVCLNELTTTCVYQAVVDYNRVGQVEILGYYDSATIINGIDRNVINSTVSVNTAQMGGFCVDALTEYHKYGHTSQYFTADVTLINRQNVADYLEGGDAVED